MTCSINRHAPRPRKELSSAQARNTSCGSCKPILAWPSSGLGGAALSQSMAWLMALGLIGRLCV